MTKDKINRANKVNKDKRIKSYIIVSIVAVAAIGVALALINFKPISSSASDVSSSGPVDGIECGRMEGSGFHIHSFLNIFIDGKPYTVPGLVGITNECFYWLHTHDTSGIVHIESPVKKNFTLGQFFDLWNKKPAEAQNFTKAISNSKDSLNVYVNGSKVANETNYKDLVLNAHDVISMVYGKPPNAIPDKYNFPQGL